MLTRRQGSSSSRAPDEGEVFDAEGEAARGAKNLSGGDGKQIAHHRGIDAHGICDVIQSSIREILRRFPVHAVLIVDADISRVANICQGVLAHKLIMPVQLVFNDIGRH